MFFSIAPSLLFSTQLSAYLEVHSFCVLHKFLIPLYERWGRMYWRDEVSNISTKYRFSFGAKIHNWFERHKKWPQNTIQCFFCTKSPAYCGCISKDCVSRSEEGKKPRVWGEYDAGQWIHISTQHFSWMPCSSPRALSTLALQLWNRGLRALGQAVTLHVSLVCWKPVPFCSLWWSQVMF